MSEPPAKAVVAGEGDGTGEGSPPVVKRRGGRRPKVAPPPPLPAATQANVVRFTADDLRMLAATAKPKLKIAVTARRLTAVARELSDLLTYHVMWVRSQAAGASRSDVSEWAEGVQRWAAEGLILLGGGDDGAKWRMVVSAAYCHLVRDVAAPEAGGPKQTPAPLIRPLSDALGLTGDGAAELAEVRTLLLRVLPALLVLGELAANVAPPPAPRKRPNSEQIILFDRLREFFEHLHAPVRFTVATGVDASPEHNPQSDEPRYGPALVWCRALFALAPQRINESGRPSQRRAANRRDARKDSRPPEEPCDAAGMRAVFDALIALSKKRYALAERIRARRARHCAG